MPRIMITSLVYLVIYLVVIGLVIWLLTYSMPSRCPSLSTAWRILVIGVLIAILLLQFAGAIDSSLPRLAR